MGSPGVRFVELMSTSNPWARGFKCGCGGCLPCQGREMLATKESLRPLPGPGQPIIPRPAREDTIAIPKCTSEGIGYVLECWQWGLQGKKYRYVGESSWSAHQRVAELLKEIMAGKKTHPMVDHFREEHSGYLQEVLFRTISQFQTALERQGWGSVEIDSTTASIGIHCLSQ